MIALFTTTIFISAALLFSVQPMVGKMILPMLGGTPSVWNLCMVFFQATLLAGYAYAHGSIHYLGVRRQAVVHILVLLLPLATLPIAFAPDTRPPTDESPSLWLLAQLTMFVGLPFLVVSTSAPLLQRWFSATGHHSAHDPYFLYAASNAGSLLALLGYPLVIEPMLTLETQTRVWAWGYWLLVALATFCVVVMRRTSTDHALQAAPSVGETREPVEPGRWQRTRWIAMAFVPSSLMLGVTTHITTDIAAVPLFWVVPLALYLLTFVLVFARRPLIPAHWVSAALPYVVLPVALLIYSNLRVSNWLIVPIHLLGFFLASMVCHQELARSRPPPDRLTEFFLLMSLGGVLGGAFNALVAPLVFNTVVEYPLVLVLACLFRQTSSRHRSDTRSTRMDYVLPVGLVALSAAAVVIRNATGLVASPLGVVLVFGLPAILCFAFKERPIRFALGLAVVTITTAKFAHPVNGNVLLVTRNFFGVKKVVQDEAGRFHRLYHGSTNHGLQSTDPEISRIPLSYYHKTGPIGDLFSMTDGRAIRTRVAVIGEGTGALASYADPGDHYTFYEIDPEVDRIARDTRYFTFLDQCRGDYDVVLGDGRLTLAAAPDASFGMVLLDAFSSDAVPTHLLSAEALDMYVSKLRDDGILAFHISNRHLNFEPMVAQLAHNAGLACLTRADIHPTPEERRLGKRPSHWMVMARRMSMIQPLKSDLAWTEPTVPHNTPVWTDQYCDILSLFAKGSRTTHD